VEISQEISLANVVLEEILQLPHPVDCVVIEENSYEHFTREEKISRKYLKQLSWKSNQG
jgi:hypothetical protein